MNLRFFLSYARNDDELHGERLIRPFFQHLVEEVGHHLGESDSPELGFIDVETPPSERWKETIRDALCEAQVLVCLMSPNYFTRHYCGREWALFEQRMQAGGRNNRILPIIWSCSPGWLPPQFAGDITFGFDSDDPERQSAFRRYAQRGLRALAAARGLALERTMYQTIVEEIALRVIALLAEGPLPALDHGQVPLLDQLPIKFPATPHSSTTMTGGMRVPSRSTTARFVALVASEGEPWDWVPYESPYDEPLGIILTRAALAAKFQPMWELVGDDITEQINAAERRTEPVVVVIDPHIADEANGTRWREQLERLDRERFGNCALLVAWPHSAQANRPALELALRTVFFRRSEDGSSRFFRLDIGVYTDLLTAVEQTLRFLEERLVARRTPRANLPSSPTRALPSVSATRPVP
jgi:hypothetical protein